MKIDSNLLKGIIRSLELQKIKCKGSLISSDEYDLIMEQSMTKADTFFKLITNCYSHAGNTANFCNYFNMLSVLDMGLLGHFLITCKNIFVAYDRIIKYQMLFSNFIEMRYSHSNSEVNWVLQMPYQLFGKTYNMEALADFELLFRLKIEETLSNKKPEPKKILLFHKSIEKNAARIEYFEERYQCEVIPAKQYNTITYNVNQIDKTIPYQNYELYKLMDQKIISIIQELYKPNEFKNNIKSILINNFEQFPLGIDEISKRLFMSTRKLQSILKRENTSYNMILNEIKIILTIDLINRNKAISEISAQLGYSDTSSFKRFIKENTGHSLSDIFKLSQEERMTLICGSK
ncbi:MAG: helix-turn-helix domain-containing protein [Chitinophagales bacterium]|nr:helix-turn-helix domain-containing protein [Chitinophagales bacterium]